MRRLFPLLVPGFVFQSIIVAGGYGTGQELSVFFLSLGPFHGLLALVLIPIPMISFCAVLCFEVSRIYKAYDYREFFKLLLGRAWFIWEIVFLSTLGLFLGVVSTAAGEIFVQAFGLPYPVGVGVLIVTVAVIVFGGNKLVERVFSFWSIMLYAVFICFFVLMFREYGDALPQIFSTRDAVLGAGNKWYVNGIAYAGLQLSMMPVVIFAMRNIQTRKQSIAAALMVGPIAVIPGILFYLIMLTHYPAIKQVVLPSNYLLESLGSIWFQMAFQIVLVGTLIETGAGVIHAFNERIANVYHSRNRVMPRQLRPSIAILLMLIAIALTRVGLVELVTIGAKIVSWLFVGTFVIPLLLVGPYLIINRQARFLRRHGSAQSHAPGLDE